MTTSSLEVGTCPRLHLLTLLQLPRRSPVQVFVCAFAAIETKMIRETGRNLFIKIKFGGLWILKRSYSRLNCVTNIR
jgi:hypothetical protein